MKNKDILKEIDKDSNIRVFTGVKKKVISSLLAGISVYMLLMTLLFTSSTAYTRRTTFVGLIVMAGFLIYPATKKQSERVNYIPWYDIVLSLLGGLCYFFFTFNQDKVIASNSTLMPLSYIVIAVVGILCLVELCRRAVGIPIIVVAGSFVAYLFYYYSRNPRLTLARVFSQTIYNLFYNINDGVFGSPIYVCTSFIILFIIMGALLEKTGIATFFIELANSIAGKTDGGPAKVAVISSGLMGMVSGSSVANTVGSGSVTIPVMKKSGYRPEFAAAVEAAASTGGQIMPPIMGAAAFLMVEIADQPYSVIAIAAIIPAVLYFTGIFMMVHLEAKKNGLKGLPKEAIPSFFKLIVNKGYLLLPIVILVICMNIYSAGMSACISIMSCMIISLLPSDMSISHLKNIVSKGVGNLIKTLTLPAIPTLAFFIIISIYGEAAMSSAILIAIILCTLLSFISKDVNMTPVKLKEALEASTRSTIGVAIACAMAGMIAAVVTATSLASTITPMIRSLTNISPICALFATMICCIILGMGVPTTATYVIMGSTIAPILINELGIPILAAHMFVFYFGIVADITPPVALAAYAGSAIAKSNPLKTGVIATKLAIAAFVIPYIFTLDKNATLLVGYTTAPASSVVLAVITALIGMLTISTGLQGYFFGHINWWKRIIFIASGLLLIYPDLTTDIIGIIVVIGISAIYYFNNGTKKVALYQEEA